MRATVGAVEPATLDGDRGSHQRHGSRGTTQPMAAAQRLLGSADQDPRHLQGLHQLLTDPLPVLGLYCQIHHPGRLVTLVQPARRSLGGLATQLRGSGQSPEQDPTQQRMATKGAVQILLDET